jgi:hypothetical protein
MIQCPVHVIYINVLLTFNTNTKQETFQSHNINDWHSSATSRYCPPCSSWVAPWTYISFPIPVDICDFRSFVHQEDILPLCRTFFGFQDELVLNMSSETKEIDGLLIVFMFLNTDWTIQNQGIIILNKGNNKITELRTILQRESPNS